jgi:tetratricopeptide (TPR) repeat protein
LENLVNSERGNEAVWTNLGAAYLGNPLLAKDSDRQEALRAFKTALEINPGAPNVAYNIALIHKDMKEYDLAADWFGEAIRANPADRDAQSQLTKIQPLITRDGSEYSTSSDKGDKLIK